MLLPILSTIVQSVQRSAAFATDAPFGTGLEWMTVAAVVLPALLLIVLVYAGQEAV